MDTALICMSSYTVIGYTHCHPNSTFSLITLANDFHDPNLIRVCYTEAFSLTAITILSHQVTHDMNSLTGSFGTLQAQTHERRIVYTSFRVLGVKFFTATKGGFHNRKLELIHLAQNSISFRSLWDITQVMVRITIDDTANFTWSMFCSRVIFQASVHAIGIHGITDESCTGLGCVLSHKEVGASLGSHGAKKADQQG